MADPIEPGDGSEFVIGVEPFDSYTPLADEMYPWVDEVRVSIELPMGPRGPEGPIPTFAVHEVAVSATPDKASVKTHLGSVHGAPPPGDGVWYFDFEVPQGPMGPEGMPGPPLNVIGELPTPPPPPDIASVGDAYVVKNADGSSSLWVWGVDPATGVGKWTEMPNYQGPKGDTGYAWVSDTVPPDDPQIGELWFRPSMMGYVPTGLQVDVGLQLGGQGGSMWGDSGELVFGVGAMGSKIEQARLSTTSLRLVTAIDIGSVRALSLAGGRLQLGSTGRVTEAAGQLQAELPTAAEDVATKGYVDGLVGGGAAGFVKSTGDTMTGHLNLVRTDSWSNGDVAAQKRYVDLSTPVGSITAHAGTRDTLAWMICDGRQVSRTEHRDLFLVCGTQYGAGNGSTTFNIPDLRGRVIVAVSPWDDEFDQVNKRGGEKAHTLTLPEMPAHTHRENDRVWSDHTGSKRFTPTPTGSVFVNTVQQGGRVPIDTYPNGGNQAHNVMQPFVALNYLIKVY